MGALDRFSESTRERDVHFCVRGGYSSDGDTITDDA
jgi:hypothetical protein